MTDEYFDWASKTLLNIHNGQTKIAEIDFAAGTIWFNGTLYAGATKSTRGNLTNVSVGNFDTIDFTSHTPSSHPLNFSSITLPATSNVIRGTSVTPTRVSGWVCFTGTLDTVSAYMDYMELHTAGTEICYGSGRFAFADSGADVDTIFSLQAITTMSEGATLASGSPLNGAYAAQFKMLFDGATIESGAVSAVACFLYQSNVTPINGEQTSVLQLSVDSGLLQNIIHINSGAHVLSTYFLNVSEAVSPFTTWGADAENCSGAPDLGIRLKVGSGEYWIPLYVNT